MVNPRRIKTESLQTFLFAHLMVTAVMAVLAFGTVESWSLALFEINALVMAVLLGVWQLFDPNFEWRRLRMALPLWLLLAWAFVQLIPFGAFGQTLAMPVAPETVPTDRLRLPTISVDPQATREAAAKLLALAIYFTVALQVLTTPARRQLATRILSIFGLVVSFLAIAQRLSWNGRLYWIRPVSAFVSPFGPFGNYNHFAGMVELLFPLPFAWLVFSRCRIEERIFHAIAVVVMIAAAVLSMSRAGILAITIQFILFGVAIMLLQQAGRARRLARIPILIVVVAVLLSLWIGYRPLMRRFDTIQQGRQEHSVVTRLAYWQASWQIFRDHAVTGVGLGAFPTIYPSYGRASSRYERVEQVHNDYLQLLTDTGMVGGIIGLTALLGLFWRWRSSICHRWRLDSKTGAQNFAHFLGAAVAVVGLLIHSLVDFNLQIASNALLFLIVTAVSLVDETAEMER
jgi:O-antigen ligase